MSYAAMLASRGGMAACGDHLGVFVGTDIKATPRGWIFVPLETATESVVAEAIETAKAGRTIWPEKESK